MAMPYFEMNCFYSADDRAPRRGMRRKTFPLKADNVTEAIEEALWSVVWRKPAKFDLRSITQDGSKVIYRSSDAK